MHFSVFQKSPLFAGISEKDIQSLIGCLSPVIRSYEKKDAICLAGDKVTSIGIIAKGVVQVINEDFLGNRSILARLSEGDLFSEAFACADTAVLPVSVYTVEPTEVYFIDYRKIITTCSHCTYHARLIANMMRILAVKNVQLSQKIETLSKKTIRDKLISYLSAQALQAKSRVFTIPFNRQELADYLGADRSALSKELGNMQKEGLLTFKKNHFVLSGGLMD
ncbi:MAG TPA: Crp/Fnr family transcriptional regulator [Clostridiales bacterium]|jgi:CRP-like cAMP-binding protein|nr:Crp/Fnr family transcriptional regulator [Clostridiales bacterium]